MKRTSLVLLLVVLLTGCNGFVGEVEVTTEETTTAQHDSTTSTDTQPAPPPKP